MTDKDLEKIIKTLVGVLNDKATWALFGSAAIVVHHGSLYREVDDVDVVVDSDDSTIINLFKAKSIAVEIKNRRGRHRGYLQIDSISVELMFMTAKNTVDVPGGKYSFDKIEQLKINDLEVPVVDLQSLLKAKERYKIFLENKKASEGLSSGEEEKLRNTLLDIEKIKKKTMFTSKNFKRIADLIYRGYYKYLFEHAVRLLRYTRLPLIRRNNFWIGAMQRNMVKYRVRFEDAVRQGKSAMPKTDDERKSLDIGLKTNNEFLRVLKDIGDGIAWRNLDYQRPLIRLMSEHAPTGPLGQDAQRMLLLLGARKKLSDRVIINDLTHCLKNADLTVVTSKGKIYLYEVKARKDKTEIIGFAEISKRVQKYKQISKQAISQWIVQMAFIDQKVQTPNREVRIVNLNFKFKTHIKRIKQLFREADKNIFSKALLEDGYHIEVCAFDKAFEKLSQEEFKKKFDNYQPFNPSQEGWSDKTLPISNYDSFYSNINERFQNYTPYSVLPFSAKDCARLMMGQLYVRICFDFLKLKEKFENAGWSVQVKDWDAVADKNKEIIKKIKEGKGGFLENMVDETIFKISKEDDKGTYTQEFSVNLVTIMLSSFYSTGYLLEMIEATYQSAKISNREGGLSTFSNQFEKHILR